MKVTGTPAPALLRSLAVVAFMATLAAGCMTPSDTKSLSAAPRATHPLGAVAFGGHWYKAFDERTSWHEARKMCESFGGYLACVESEAEQAFIASLAGGRYLSLGATDEAIEGSWVWVNGAAFRYTRWMDGQPNNYGGCENYLATYDGGDWVDVADEGDGFWMPTGYICEWEK